jgi:Ca2+-binding RTX toxin-like protein
MGGSDTIVGGSSASFLYGFNASGGTDGTDSLLGGGAGDYLQGNSGNDTLDGGAGSDRVLGGSGNDSILGSAGNDSINGNTGNDTADGGADNDLVRGGQGNDSISGGAANDQLFGDLGTDSLDGGAGIDSFTGGGGNDILGFSGVNGTGTTVSSVTYYDTVLDYVDGEDEFRILGSGGCSATAFGDAAADAELIRGVAGATFTTVSAATTYAQQLLDANASATDVAIVKVGNDTYLFYESAGTGAGAIDSIVKLAGVTDTSLLTFADFG